MAEDLAGLRAKIDPIAVVFDIGGIARDGVDLGQIRPAPRAHLYFAPSTITGISVEYGYAGMP